MKPKKIYTTLYNNYQDGGFKNVNIISNMIGIQCGWVKVLFNNKMRNWKILPLELIVNITE